MPAKVVFFHALCDGYYPRRGKPKSVSGDQQIQSLVKDRRFLFQNYGNPYEMGKRVAATIADFEAYKTAKSYVVAESSEPLTLYVFAANHPDLPRRDMTVLWEIS